MLVKGNSGFCVELVDESTVRKSAKGSGSLRLKRQIEKQILFHDTPREDSVRAPKVFRMEGGADQFQADMEFIAARDFIQFLSEADRRMLDGFLSAMIEFIRNNLALCSSMDVSEQIDAKLAELARSNVPETYIKAAARLCNSPVHVPVGPCHGDLTLSNILFKNTHLYLLDFLDCYVESPLQDIVKLRQDTLFAWSLQLYQAEFNRTKIQIILRYLDRRIDAAFLPDPWYRSHYELFQLVNLMRVIPYCKDGATTALVTEGLDRLLARLTIKND